MSACSIDCSTKLLFAIDELTEPGVPPPKAAAPWLPSALELLLGVIALLDEVKGLDDDGDDGDTADEEEPAGD